MECKFVLGSLALCLASAACSSSVGGAPVTSPEQTRAATSTSAISNARVGVPLRGALEAELTFVSVFEPTNAESRALFAALDAIQHRIGYRSVRWMLVHEAHSEAERDPVQLEVQSFGGAAAFDYLVALGQRAEAGHLLTLPERLQIGLALTRGLSHATTLDPDEDLAEFEFELVTEASALLERDAAASMLSVNGIHVRGLLSATRLEELVEAELVAARELRARKGRARQVFAERVRANRGKLFDSLDRASSNAAPGGVL